MHGDLTPRNVMATKAGHVKLLDFGLARAAGETSRMTKKTERVERFGTLAFMAPEILKNEGHQPNPRSDVFSFGLILHQMLTGRHPFGSRRPDKVAQAICTREAKALPGVPASLAAIIDRCLQKDPQERFASASELWEAFPKRA
jgi:eukaryotic-like serine/threonine-protein kinase